MRDCQQSSPSPLVVFDTNVVESRYVGALLRGEVIRDFSLMRAHENEYMPALALKSVFEILHHAKLGDPVLPWMDSALGYPGGVEEGWRILQQLPECATRENLFYWFGLCEEWRGLDWEAERELIERFVRPEEKQSALRNAAVREQFARWKFRLQAFCERVRSAIESEMHIVVPGAGSRNDRAMSLMLEIGNSSLVPNEDLEILVSALVEEAAAFVTADSRVLMQSGLSLSLNYKTAFVHPEQLPEAIGEQFLVRWSHSQSRPPARKPRMAG